jgi:hypothetical protein
MRAVAQEQSMSTPRSIRGLQPDFLRESLRVDISCQFDTIAQVVNTTAGTQTRDMRRGPR